MRMTGGEFGGRRIRAPAGDRVRPTQDRVRAALFSMLAEVVPGARVLDLFAGSGAVGLEALSRGATAVVWVEADRRHAAVLRENVQKLAVGAEQGQVVCAEAMAWLQRADAHAAPFDLVFADPPYEWAQAQGFAALAALLKGRGVLRPGGLFVAEQSVRTDAAVWAGWDLLRDRAYGHTRLAVYRLAAPLAPADRQESDVHA